MVPQFFKTIRYRIKDKNTSKMLGVMARDSNLVWNVINAASRKKWKESRKVFHKFDPWFTEIMKGASKELSINAQTIQAIMAQFHKDIHQQKKQLRFRGKKSKKWIPFKGQTIKICNDTIVYDGKKFRIWNSFKIPGEIKSGCFSQDSTGKWFISFIYEAELKNSNGRDQVGIDLGLKTTATCSNGETLELKSLSVLDKKIANLQKARRFKRVKIVHKKKSNIRKDRIYKFALGLVKTNDLIAVGNISGFTSGKLAKSRYQNSWSMLRRHLEFKAAEYQVSFCEVSEYLTTQRCNICGSIEGPRGIKELSVREWACSCGAGLNRDVNAAINILSRARCLAS